MCYTAIYERFIQLFTKITIFNKCLHGLDKSILTICIKLSYRYFRRDDKLLIQTSNYMVSHKFQYIGNNKRFHTNNIGEIVTVLVWIAFFIAKRLLISNFHVNIESKLCC